MNSKEKALVLDTMREYGRKRAEELQNNSADLSNTEINAQEEYIPLFTEAVKLKNMLSRQPGFICKSSEGRVVRLLQVYDSNIYTQEPEELPAQWGFVWSTDPSKAKPFIALATSPYNLGDCCLENGKTYKSNIDNNVYPPSAYPQGWTEI